MRKFRLIFASFMIIVSLMLMITTFYLPIPPQKFDFLNYTILLGFPAITCAMCVISLVENLKEQGK